MAGGRSARGASFTPEQRAAWGAARDIAAGRGAHSAGIDALPRAPYGPPKPLQLSVKLDTRPALLKANTAAANKAPKNTPLSADMDSTCFASLDWEDGVVYAVFTNGAEYEADCSRKMFLEWISYGSLGGYYWDELGGSEEGFFS
jgi:hypothetical protein